LRNQPFQVIGGRDRDEAGVWNRDDSRGIVVADVRPIIEDLVALAPPPASPIDAGSPDQWEEIEQRLGKTLPSDYKQIVNLYGTGTFNDLFYIFNPFSNVEQFNLMWQAGLPGSLTAHEDLGRVYPIGSNLEELQAFAIDDRDLCPYPVYPEPGGLLPLGGTSNAGHTYWLTEGNTEEWPLVLLPRGFQLVEQHPVPLVGFLVLWLSGELPECFNGVGKRFLGRTDPVFQAPLYRKRG
jgi:hypothetical protein